MTGPYLRPAARKHTRERTVVALPQPQPVCLFASSFKISHAMPSKRGKTKIKVGGKKKKLEKSRTSLYKYLFSFFLFLFQGGKEKYTFRALLAPIIQTSFLLLKNGRGFFYWLKNEMRRWCYHGYDMSRTVFQMVVSVSRLLLSWSPPPPFRWGLEQEERTEREEYVHLLCFFVSLFVCFFQGELY